MRFTKWIDALAARGRFVFTLADAAQAAGSSPDAAKLSIQHAARAGVLYSPARGLWVIVPAEDRAEGIASWRLYLDPMLRREGRSYYLGLLSAAAQHGASAQASQEVQVIVDRPRAAIQAGRQRIVFVTRRRAALAPTTPIVVPTGRIPVSTPEMTALDLVAYPAHAGGWGNVITVLRDLAPGMTATGMQAVAGVQPATTDIQRLGWLLEDLDAEDAAAPLRGLLAERATTFVPLDPRARRDGPRDSRWRIIENVAVEPD